MERTYTEFHNHIEYSNFLEEVETNLINFPRIWVKLSLADVNESIERKSEFEYIVSD